MKKLFTMFSLCLFLVTGAAATTLAWDANPASENVIQYNIAISQTPDVYQAAFNTTQTQFTLPEGSMTACNVYYLAVQAQNSAGLVSDWASKTDTGDYVIVDMTDPAICGPSVPTGLSVQMTINPDGSVTVVIN